MSQFIPPGMGWQPESYDPRDYARDTGEARDMTSHLADTEEPEIDLTEYFPEIEDQGPLNSCCAFAVLGLVEYFDGRCFEAPLGASRLFLYQMGLRLRGTADDLGSDLRTTLKALRRFGSPVQQQWPYRPKRFRERPVDPFLFGFADEYRHICYFRVGTPLASALDSGHRDRLGNLHFLKSALAAQMPFLIGFHVPSTLTSDGLVYGLDRARTIRGGQAVIVVGYDDEARIASHKGAFRIRNSWGKGWGAAGYGWLPYDLLGTPAVSDAWMMVSTKWASSVLNP